VADAMALAGRLSALLSSEAGEGHRGVSAGATRAGSIPVRTEAGERFIDPAEIDWIEAEDYYAGVHTGGKRFRVRESLTAFEARLDPARFVRIHRSVIVRLDLVREWKAADAAGDVVVVLRDGTVLPVSRRRVAEVKALLRPAR
jgi:two-component system LytT family response regulator